MGRSIQTSSIGRAARALLAFVLAVAMSIPVAAFGDESAKTRTVAQGTWGTCAWDIDEQGTLTVHPGNGAEPDASNPGFDNKASDDEGQSADQAAAVESDDQAAGNLRESPWKDYADDIVKVVFLKEDNNMVVAPQDISYVLAGLAKLQEADLSGLDARAVRQQVGLFKGDAKLAKLVLGKSIKLDRAALTEPAVGEEYTGKWAGPAGTFSSQELMQAYDGATMAGEYSWEQAEGNQAQQHEQELKQQQGQEQDQDQQGAEPASQASAEDEPDGVQTQEAPSTKDDQATGAAAAKEEAAGQDELKEPAQQQAEELGAQSPGTDDIEAAVEVVPPASADAASTSYRYARVMSDGYLYTTDSTGTMKGRYYWGGSPDSAKQNLAQVDILFIDSDVQTLVDVKMKNTNRWGSGTETNLVKFGASLVSDFAIKNFSKVVFKLDAAGSSAFNSLRASHGASQTTAAVFKGCERLKTVENFHKTKVTSLGNNTFVNCKMLTSIMLPKTCTIINDGYISEGCFAGCSSLSRVLLGGVEQIGYNAFIRCTALSSIEMPASVDRIGGFAFADCENLKRVALQNTQRVVVGYAAFQGTPVAASGNANYFYVPNSVYASYRGQTKTNEWYTNRYDSKVRPFLEVSGIADQTYTGKAIEPAVKVTWLGRELVAQNYTVAYKDNVAAGTATATVTGRNGYVGTASTTFEIVKKESSTPSSGGSGQGKGSVSPPKKSVKWTRLDGYTAYDTMRTVVKTGFSKSNTVVVANFDACWDALSASSLAGKYNAPILLTAMGSLSPACRSEIERLGAKKVYIVGGTAVVSARVERQIKSIPCVTSVTRKAGNDAQKTAVAVANEVGSAASSTAIVATSNGYWDALAASPYAYAKKAPIYLTEASGTIRNDVVTKMRNAGVKRVVIIGGTAAVNTTTERRLASAGISVIRKGGLNAIQTSMLFAEWALKQGMSANKMGVATVNGHWDALTGGPLCGKNNAVLVLAASDNNSAITRVAGANKAKISQGYVFGGEKAVSQKSFKACENATR